MKIIFMGTPDFAVCSLSALIEAKHQIIGVFSQPDKPQGRHQTITPTPVKQLALEHNIKVYQPKTLKDAEIQQEIINLDSDLIVVAAYGKLLPKEVLEASKYGCINVHGSLLPKYRGAAPIQWAVINDEPTVGVTIMEMAEGMDTGNMLLVSETAVGEDETAGQLFSRLALVGAEALVKAISILDSLESIPQDHSQATWASPLKKEDGLIDFSLSAKLAYARFRGVTPAPSAYAIYKEKRLKIIEARLSELSGEVGTLLSQKSLIIGCGECSMELLRVQPEGVKPMDGSAFLNGQRLKLGDKLF